MSIGRAIKDIRKEKCISQEKLAIETNLSRKYVYTLESINSNPTLSVLEKISEVLDIKVSDLIIKAESYK